MIKIQNNLKKVICSVSTLCLVTVLSNSAGAFEWPWSKSKSKQQPPVSTTEVKKESIEAIEAHKMYVEATKVTQEAYSEYQQSAAEYSKAHIDTSKSYEDLQKAAAIWTEAVAERDKAYDRWCIDCNPKGEAYGAWVEAARKERESLLNKEKVYVEWSTKQAIEQKLREEKDAAYSKYAAALINQRTAHTTWARICREDIKSV